MAGRLFFTVFTSGTGRELWVSDGTEEGTFPLSPAHAGSSIVALAAVADRLFFTTFTAGTGTTELWVSDGTLEGTVRFRDTIPGAAFSSPSIPTAVAGWLFFIASTPETGRELWVSDGTPEGTRLVRDIIPGAASAFGPGTGDLTAVRDRLFFVAAGGLWVSDGTPEGTRPLGAGFPFDFDAGGTGGNLTAVGDRLFCTASTFQQGRELWVSDGTPEGTRLVRDINPGNASAFFFRYASGSSQTGTGNLRAVGGRVFFFAFQPVTGVELWASDGTLEGTRLVRDIFPGSAGSVYVPLGLTLPQTALSRLTAVGNRVFFVASDGVHGQELWVVTPASVESIEINGGSLQRSRVTSLTVTFSSLVTLQPGAFLVIAETGAPVSVDVNASEVDGRTIAVLTFTGGPLPDGRYALVIRSNRILDCLGDPLDADGDGTPGGDRVETFFCLFGDSDGDGDVDDLDAERFLGAFGRSAGDPDFLPYFDFDNNDTVDEADWLEFSARLGTTLGT